MTEALAGKMGGGAPGMDGAGGAGGAPSGPKPKDENHFMEKDENGKPTNKPKDDKEVAKEVGQDFQKNMSESGDPMMAAAKTMMEDGPALAKHAQAKQTEAVLKPVSVVSTFADEMNKAMQGASDPAGSSSNTFTPKAEGEKKGASSKAQGPAPKPAAEEEKTAEMKQTPKPKPR